MTADSGGGIIPRNRLAATALAPLPPIHSIALMMADKAEALLRLVFKVSKTRPC